MSLTSLSSRRSHPPKFPMPIFLIRPSYRAIIAMTAQSASGRDFTGAFKGDATLAETPVFDGKVELDAKNIAALAKELGQDVKGLSFLDASGQVSLTGDSIKLTNVTAKTGGILNADYKGGATLGDVPAYDGSFNVAIASLSDFAQVTATEIPYSDAIGKITIDGQVSGQGENITLPTLSAALSDGKINGRYDGQAKWDKGASLDGRLNIDIPSLRDVAKSAGTELPPSTKTGTIFERFSVNGTVKGTPENIQFGQAELVMDSINGRGDFAVDMTSAKPFVTGVMDLDGLDLAPYMAAYTAQNPTGEIQPWSTAPINTAPLRAVDGDFKLTTPNIKTDRLTMGPGSAV